jgi:hypothetical protein
VTDKKTRLTWIEDPYSYVGSAGDVRLFSVTWRSRREDPCWLMRSELPGFTGREWKADDKDALLARAEELLGFWLAKVGGDKS